MASVEQSYQKRLVQIATNIKQVRKSRKLSQRDMEQFGFDLRNYQRLEAGKHSPSVFTLHKLALAFKVPLSRLVK